MSHDSEDVTPSIDRYQPQHVIRRQHVQLRAPSEQLQQTGNGNPPRDDDFLVKMASTVTADAIKSVVETYAAEQLLGSSEAGSKQDRKYYPPAADDLKSAGTSSDTVQPQPSLDSSEINGVEDKRSAGNESASRPTDVAAVSNHLTKPETVSTSGDGPEAEALQDIARLQALTRQLRAVVAESRSADGLPTNVDDGETTTLSSTDLEKQGAQTTSTKDNDDTEDGDDGALGSELISQAKQSRSEKKARKALCKLGLKPVTGVAQVTIRRKKNSIFTISRPDVYVNSACDTYIIFGEARLEDAEDRAKQEAAKNFVGTSTAPARYAGNVDTAADNDEQVSDTEEVDETGLSAQDIELVMSQAGVSRSHAVRALRDNDNDIVNALMDLTT